jgi:hypothetical protein
VAHAVAYFAVNVGVEAGDLLTADREALLGGCGEGGDGPGAVAIGLAEVLGDVDLDAVVLDQVDEEGLGVAVGTDKTDTVGLAGTVKRSFVLNFGSADQSSVSQ